MPSIFSTSPGGATTYGQDSTISSGPAFGVGGSADDWMQGLNTQAAKMNASQPYGGGGGMMRPGTSIGGGWIAKSIENQYDNPGIDLQRQQLAFQQSKWNQAFGALTGMLGTNPFQIGGQNTQQPEITTGGVYTPQQIDQQVSATRAKNDQATATAQKQAADAATGRGFGVNSPLIAALQNNLAGQGIAANAAAENQIRQTAAQQNAQQLLGTQTERQNAWEAANTLAIQRAKPYFDRQNALIAALAGIA